MAKSVRSSNYKKSSLYKGVSSCFIRTSCSGQTLKGIKFCATITHRGTTYNSKLFEYEREAALWYDKKRLELGLEPVNILKRQSPKFPKQESEKI